MKARRAYARAHWPYPASLAWTLYILPRGVCNHQGLQLGERFRGVSTDSGRLTAARSHGPAAFPQMRARFDGALDVTSRPFLGSWGRRQGARKPPTDARARLSSPSLCVAPDIAMPGTYSTLDTAWGRLTSLFDQAVGLPRGSGFTQTGPRSYFRRTAL